MARTLNALALAAALALSAGAAHAAPVAFAYDLQPGRLAFTVDSAAITPAGFATAAPGQGLLDLTLNIAGQSFLANADQFFPSQPVVTLVGRALSFAAFSPLGAGGVAYDFTASGTANPARFDYTFTGSNGVSLAGVGTVASSAAVPEPASLGMLAAGMLGLAYVRRRA